jgi:DNA-binding transcriptional regulator YdaS (Cro superfamily)
VITTTRESHMLESTVLRDCRIVAAIRKQGVYKTARRAGFAGSIVSQWINGQIYLPERTCQIICEAAGCIDEWRTR